MPSNRLPHEWLVSIDDHVIEPPDLWTSRLPTRYHGSCPQFREDDRGPAWFYEGKRIVISGIVTQAGAPPDGYDPQPVRYSDMPEYCYDPKARLAAMTADGVLASMVFPNLPRFAGQEFSEGRDKDLAMLCVKAYNDFILDEWSAEDPDRLISAVIIPYWDPRAAAMEIERCAAKGARSVLFSEHPPSLGWPSIHDADRYWDPVFSAVHDADLALSIHFASSSKIPSTGFDAPFTIPVTLIRWTSATTCTDWIFSDIFARFPRVRISLSEGGISWFPLVMESASYVVEHYMYLENFVCTDPSAVQFERRATRETVWPHGDKTVLDVYREHVRACFVAGLAEFAETERGIFERWGTDLFLAEADFPHHDSTYPNTVAKYDHLLAGFDQAAQLRLRQDNAIEWYGLDRDRLHKVAEQLSG